MFMIQEFTLKLVICRIGSLEMFMIQEFTLKLVICRIGSLENNSPEYLISE